MRRTHGDPQFEPDMPSVDAEYLLGYLFEVGPSMLAGGYQGPLTYGELQAWQEQTGIELEPWEARFLRRLSGEYIAEMQRAEKRDCQAPMRIETGSRDIAAVAMSLQRSLRELAKL